MDEVISEGEQKNIPTNLRLLFVIEQMASAGVPVTPTDVNQILGLPKPTIHRLFATLEAEGFIQREIDGRGYSPGMRLRTMSSGIISSLRIRVARVAILTELAEATGETCNIALAERDGMVYIDRIETKWPLRIQLPIGSRVPFFCTASGKLYLSSLSKTHLKQYVNSAKFNRYTKKTIDDSERLIKEVTSVRKQQFAIDNQEFMDGMIALGVPILDANNRLVSTLSFHAPVQRLSIDEAMKHLPLLRELSQKLSALLS